MTSISIIDSGYNTTNKDGTPNSGVDITSLGSYIAYGGQPITFNCQSIRGRSGLNVSDEPNPSSNDSSNIHYTSFNNRIFEIDYLINVTNVLERGLFKEMSVLDKTNGIKILYASTTNDNIKSTIEIIGRTNTKFNTIIGTTNLSSLPILLGKVVGFSFDQAGGSRKYQIKGTLTFEEEKAPSRT